MPKQSNISQITSSLLSTFHKISLITSNHLIIGLIHQLRESHPAAYHQFYRVGHDLLPWITTAADTSHTRLVASILFFAEYSPRPASTTSDVRGYYQVDRVKPDTRRSLRVRLPFGTEIWLPPSHAGGRDAKRCMDDLYGQ